MKCTVIISDEREEIVIYTKQRDALVEKIEAIVENSGSELVGLDERGESVVVSAAEVTAFTVIDGCVWAILDTGRLKMRTRLYELEASLSKSFVRINKSALINIEKIRSFSTGFGCSLEVNFKNGYKDYVSRRQIKTLKERLVKR